jgi:hypothetical protein
MRSDARPGANSFGRFVKSMETRDEPRRHLSAIRHLRLGAILIFGIIFPLALLSQAFLAVRNADFQAFETIGIEKSLPAQMAKLARPEDYTLYALVFVETSNRKVMLNKQMMKMAVIHIGFAVISVGMLLLLLGIDAGGMDLEGEHKALGTKLNLKIASTGVVVFVVGATMAALGGLLINQYKTIDIPRFGGTTEATVPISAQRILDEYDKCHSQYEKLPMARACIANWMDDTIH